MVMSVDGTDTDEEHTITMGMTADLLELIMQTCILNPHVVFKCSQMVLVFVDFKVHDPKWFQCNLQVSSSTFDRLLEMIEMHPIFSNDAIVSQSPVSMQLAIVMFQFGHDGNAASVEVIAQWSGVSASSVVNCMCRVMIAFLVLHDSAIHWPSEEEKEELKEWVEVVSCFAWRDGYCMVNGTPVILFQKPGYHGEVYFNRKSNYSLDLQVRFTLFLHVHLLIMTAHYPPKSLYNRLCDWALWKCT